MFQGWLSWERSGNSGLTLVELILLKLAKMVGLMLLGIVPLEFICFRP